MISLDDALTSLRLPRGWRLFDRDRGLVVIAEDLSWWAELEMLWRQSNEETLEDARELALRIALGRQRTAVDRLRRRRSAEYQPADLQRTSLARRRPIRRARRR
jgi:hypothetical protein